LKKSKAGGLGVEGDQTSKVHKETQSSLTARQRGEGSFAKRSKSRGLVTDHRIVTSNAGRGKGSQSVVKELRGKRFCEQRPTLKKTQDLAGKALRWERPGEGEQWARRGKI